MDREKLRRNLMTRGRALRSIRRFFDERSFLEVETPLLAPAPGMEPHLAPFATELLDPSGPGRREMFLTTSPEHAMKRLLASGFGNIYQITRSFRNREIGPLHQPEFTILEWYRTGCDYRAVMEDCEALVHRAALDASGSPWVRHRGQRVSVAPPWARVTVRDAVLQRTGIDVLACPDAAALQGEAARRGLPAGEPGDAFDDLFFRIFLDHVEPHLGLDRPVILFEYPASMAALARLCPGRPLTAERFEVYIAGLEIANAFSELTDAREQRRRFEQERIEKERACGRSLPMDEAFLSALDAGLPECAGIALGVDRLVMLLCGAETIREVVAFPFEPSGEHGRG